MLPIKIDLPEAFLEEEVRDGYTVTTAVKKVWAVELDLLNELARVCAENDIELLSVGGTILGAARHGGFIPWDDDIDLMMTRENYKKLCACAPTAFSYPYFFQTEETDPGSMRGHAQLRNSETTAILEVEKEKNFKFNQGIFIDIFPMDNLPDDEKAQSRFLRKVHFKYKLTRAFALFSSRYTKHANIGIKGTFIKILGPIISSINRVIPVSKFLYRQYEKTASLYSKKQTKKMGAMPILLVSDRVIWNSADIKSGVTDLKFEFMTMPTPVNYEALLDWQYGDWHKFVVGSSLHGDVLFDAEKSYKEYLK